MTERRSDRLLAAAAVVIIAVILVGEVVVYTSDYTEYSADATFSDGTLEYTVSADGSKTYSVVVSDNGGHVPVGKLYVYYDESYPSNYERAQVPVGAQELDQEYLLRQLVAVLEYRNFHDVEYVDARGLAEVMGREGDSAGIGVVVASGALPDTVYTGSADDPVFSWMASGGSLYWMGNLLGECYGTPDGELHHVEGYQQLFLGAECLNTGDTSRALSDVDNDYRDALSLMNNRVDYAVNPDLLPADRDCLALGYAEDGYVSIALVSYGSGMVCVLGGDFSNNLRNDLAQVIASGIGPGSSILAVETGTVTRGTSGGSVEGLEGQNMTAYIYLGGYYPVYGRQFQL